MGILLELANGNEGRVEEMIDDLSTGGPHHVMANIIMVHIAEALIALARTATQKDSGECKD